MNECQTNSTRLSLGLHAHQNGLFHEAERFYRQVLEDDSTNVDSLHLLGMLRHELGDSQNALKFINLAIAQMPGSAMLHNAMAVVLIAAKDFAAAERSALEAVSIDAAMVEPRFNLVTVFQAIGEQAKAMDQLSTILSLDPRRNDAIKLLYELSVATGRLDRITAACVDVLQRLPDSPAAHLTLGLMFSSRTSPESLQSVELAERSRLMKLALYHLQIAASQNPCAECFDAWANALMLANEHITAIEKLDIAISLDDRFVRAFESRGRAKLELGQTEAAVADFELALARDPYSAVALLELAKMKRTPSSGQSGSDDDLVSRLERQVGRTDLHPRQRSLFHFAIGHIHEGLGDFDLAFEHFRQGNAGKEHAGAPSSSTANTIWSDKVAEIESTFVDEQLARLSGACESELPVFIVSMPRSGSTLTETLIARHPAVVAGGELFEITDIAQTLSRRLASQFPYPSCMAVLTDDQAKLMGEEYVRHVLARTERLRPRERSGAVQRTTDKMPMNFWHLGLIARILPKAKIIHVRRDPLDVCLSCFKQNLRWPFCDLDAIADYYIAYERMMKFWSSILPVPILEIHYEDLVAAPELQTRRMISHCGLDWDDACLREDTSRQAIRTPSKWQVCQPIYETSIKLSDNYQKQLSDLSARLTS
jgi:tetratricopeptide (TPR) repeat protein